jgi:penicillin amidase
VTGDVQDLFIVDDGDVTGIRHEPIVVRGEEEPAPHEVRETRHGPILDRLPVGDRATIYEDVEGTYALRWVGAEVGLRPSTVLRFATAGDFGTFRLAVGEVACPGQNFVYADVEGHIGLQVTGLHPRRRHGDGSVPAADHGWDGWIPTEELPWALDPPEGIIVTANDGLAHAAFGPHVLSADYHQPTRARRIRELLAAGSRHDVASFGAIQRDTVSLAARETVPLLIDAVNAGADVGAVTGHRRAALDLLAGWDHDLAADSPAAALYEVWSEALARRVLRARMGEALFRVYTASTETWKAAVMPALLRDPAGWLDPGTVGAALDDALDELGDPIPAWGALHRLRLAHPLAELPGLEPLFVAVDEPAAGDELTVCVTAMDHVAGRHVAVTASWRAVFDLADLAAAAWTVPSGVSGDPASPHWCDQAAAHREGAPGAGLSPISTLGVSPS